MINLLSLKMRNVLTTILIAFVAFVQTAPLAATGWGTLGEAVQYEDLSWDPVFLEKDGLHVTLKMPTFFSAKILPSIEFIGMNSESNSYVLRMYDVNFQRPLTNEEFAADIQSYNSDHIVTPVDPAIYGADFAVSLTPATLSYFQSFIYNQNDSHFIFFIKGDKFLHVGTNESKESRRTYFFDSIRFN